LATCIASLEDLARGAVIQCLVQSLVVIKIEVGGDPLPGLGHALIGAEIGE